VLVEFVLAVIFVAFNFTGSYDLAAIFEWIIAFIFSFYVFSFVLDLWPAVHTRDEQTRFVKPSHMSPAQMEENRLNEGSPRRTGDSERPLRNQRGARF
jgi:hypothetical protein